MLPIQINGNPVDTSPPSSGRPLASHHAAHHAPELEETPATNYLVIQTKAPVHSAEKTQLAANNIKIHEVVSPNTYLCSYKDQNSDVKPSPENLRASLDSFVVYADIYRPGVVVERALKDPGAATESGTVSVDILVHNDIDANSIVEEVAAKAGIAPSDIHVVGSKLRVTVPQESLASVAGIDQVKTINALPVFRGLNNKANGIMDVYKGVGPEASKLFKGKGQTVCVADTGFDTGKLGEDEHHEAFQDRVLKVFPLGRPQTKDASDPSGHGTHVCGSVLGRGHHTSEGKVEGPASEADLIVQSLFNRWYNTQWPEPAWDAGFGGIPERISMLFAQATAEGASVHTNSWGSFLDLDDVMSQQEIFQYREAITADIDEYLHKDKNLVVLFAAGNSGSDTDNEPGRIDPGSIGAEATSKNIITVGASENYRPDQLYPSGRPRVYSPLRFKHERINTDNVANNPEGLAAFSSRGPSKPDGRIKPDVVAPGTTILSARSSVINPPGHFTEGWGVSNDKKWCFSGGTSMACPLVAGCCAVIRGAMVDTFPTKQPPPATAIKAVLINGAVPLKGQYQPEVEFKAPPNSDYGFGRVNLHNSLLHVVPDAPGTAGYGTGPRLADNGVDPRDWKLRIPVPEEVQLGDGGLTLKVTVTWADRPGAWLQNNLNLTVSDMEKTLWGNGIDGNDREGGDRINNVEQVIWKGVQKGKTYQVNVRAYSIPDDEYPQDFSYAWRIFS